MRSEDDVYASKTSTVVIDSRDRDLKLYPDPARYDVTLDEEIQDVTSVELMCAEVPMVSYTVSTRNNLIHVAAFGSSTFAAPLVAEVDVGNYTKEELATAVQAALNAAVSNEAFVVQYHARLDNYDVYSASSFALSFATSTSSATVAYAPRTAARLLGFGPKRYASAAAEPPPPGQPAFTNTVRAPHRCDLDTDRYAVLHIEPAYVNYSATNNTVLNRSFAILPKSLSALNLRVDESRIKTFNPPLAKFAKMRVTFYDPQGELYDFQNRDHRLEFRFTVIRQMKYSQQRMFVPFEGTISDR